MTDDEIRKMRERAAAAGARSSHDGYVAERPRCQPRCSSAGYVDGGRYCSACSPPPIGRVLREYAADVEALAAEVELLRRELDNEPKCQRCGEYLRECERCPL
jgi:hypothetical protein